MEQWFGVEGGQDALGDLSKSCTRDKRLHVSRGVPDWR